jgi:hypothetical protein
MYITLLTFLKFDDMSKILLMKSFDIVESNLKFITQFVMYFNIIKNY